jgi:hypothetical protein
MIEQSPAAAAVGAARQKHLKRIMPRDADRSPAPVPEQRLHFSAPLAMRRAAERKTVRKESRPVISRRVVPGAKALAEKIFNALFAMGEMRVSPEPGRERFLLVRNRLLACYSLVQCGLRREQAIKSR